MKTLTAYFSMKGQTIAPGMKIVDLAKGHTAVAAEAIHTAVGGDLFEMETVKIYNRDHMQMICEAQDEQKRGIRPELKSYPESLDAYDTVFLCYPNWWNTLPMPVLGFMERYDWTGKRIIPVNTSEGSGAGKSAEKIREVCKGARVEAPYELIGSQVDGRIDEIRTWAAERMQA